MYRLTFLFLILSLSITSVAQSQGQGESYTVIGLKVSGGVNTLNGVEKYAKLNGLTYDNPPRFLGDVGLVIQTMFPNKFMLQGEITFGGKSLELEETSNYYNGHIRRVDAVPTLDLTCYVGTKVPLNNDIRFVVGAGPYLGINLERLAVDVEFLAEWDEDPDEEEYESSLLRGGNDRNGRYYNYLYEHKYIEVGVSIMAGFEVKSWQLGFNYGHGLTNLLYHASPIKSRSYKLSVVKFF